MTKGTILVVDDDQVLRRLVGKYLRAKGYEILEADSCRSALEIFERSRPDAAVLDYAVPDGTALDLLPRLKALDPSVPLVVVTAHGSIDLAVRAIKEGAEQFLTKPIELPALRVVVERLLEQRRTARRQVAGRLQGARSTVDPFAGESPAVRRLAEEVERVLATDRPILIQGETGTGKGVLARWIHRNGPRGEEPFVNLNCAGLSRELLETELFGHEKGAFTGAVADKVGLFEAAHRGTIFLDEIGDMDLIVQPKLLTVLEEKTFRRLGGVRDRVVDVRLLAATHKDLTACVREKTFRSDLYFRISTIPLTIPPLRERREDIADLAARMLGVLAAELGRGEVRLTPEGVRALEAYDWPGNIRELRNVLERALLLHDGPTLTGASLRFDAVTEQAAPGRDVDLTLAENERQHIEYVLRHERGNVERASARLGIGASALYKKIKRLGIAVPK